MINWFWCREQLPTLKEENLYTRSVKCNNWRTKVGSFGYEKQDFISGKYFPRVLANFVESIRGDSSPHAISRRSWRYTARLCSISLAPTTSLHLIYRPYTSFCLIPNSAVQKRLLRRVMCSVAPARSTDRTCLELQIFLLLQPFPRIRIYALLAIFTNKFHGAGLEFYSFCTLLAIRVSFLEVRKTERERERERWRSSS
jgi:hypothetical protein